MAFNSVSTDPLIAVYPVFVAIGGHIFMKERLGVRQYPCLAGVILGSILIIVDTVL